MTPVLVLGAAMLTIAAALLLVRLTVGPTILDRSVALDVLVAVTVCATGLYVAHSGVTYALPMLVVLAGCGMVGAVSVARYASRSDDLGAGDRDDRGAGGAR
jgi:multicomponent Na+:H+ antiporter subunit F